MLVAGLLSTGLTLAFSSIEGGMQHPTFGATWDSVTTSPVKGLTFHPTLEVNIGVDKVRNPVLRRENLSWKTGEYVL